MKPYLNLVNPGEKSAPSPFTQTFGGYAAKRRTAAVGKRVHTIWKPLDLSTALTTFMDDYINYCGFSDDLSDTVSTQLDREISHKSGMLEKIDEMDSSCSVDNSTICTKDDGLFIQDADNTISLTETKVKDDIIILDNDLKHLNLSESVFNSTMNVTLAQLMQYLTKIKTFMHNFSDLKHSEEQYLNNSIITNRVLVEYINQLDIMCRNLALAHIRYHDKDPKKLRYANTIIKSMYIPDRLLRMKTRDWDCMLDELVNEYQLFRDKLLNENTNNTVPISHSVLSNDVMHISMLMQDIMSTLIESKEIMEMQLSKLVSLEFVPTKFDHPISRDDCIYYDPISKVCNNKLLGEKYPFLSDVCYYNICLELQVDLIAILHESKEYKKYIKNKPVKRPPKTAFTPKIGKRFNIYYNEDSLSKQENTTISDDNNTLSNNQTSSLEESSTGILTVEGENNSIVPIDSETKLGIDQDFSASDSDCVNEVITEVEENKKKEDEVVSDICKEESPIRHKKNKKKHNDSVSPESRAARRRRKRHPVNNYLPSISERNTDDNGDRKTVKKSKSKKVHELESSNVELPPIVNPIVIDILPSIAPREEQPHIDVSNMNPAEATRYRRMKKKEFMMRKQQLENPIVKDYLNLEHSTFVDSDAFGVIEKDSVPEHDNCDRNIIARDVESDDRAEI